MKHQACKGYDKFAYDSQYVPAVLASDGCRKEGLFWLAGRELGFESDKCWKHWEETWNIKLSF